MRWRQSGSRSNTMDLDHPKAELKKNFDEDNEDASLAKQESQGSMSKLQRLQLKARENMKASADEKLKKIKLGDGSVRRIPDHSEAKAQEENFDEDNGDDASAAKREYKGTLSKLQQLQEDARENIKASAAEKLKKINTEGEGSLKGLHNERNGSSINSDGEDLQVEKIENDFDKSNGMSKPKRLQLQARASIENSDNKLQDWHGNLEEAPSQMWAQNSLQVCLTEEDDTPALESSNLINLMQLLLMMTL